jgi:Uma2 family endonuclease
MAGSKPNHNQLAINLTSAINYNLRKKPYRVFMSDLRLWIPDCRLYTYPDVMIVQTPLIFAENRQDTIVNPLAIAEILSDSTEKYDRGDKFRMYRSIPSFKEYLLVSEGLSGESNSPACKPRQTAMQVEKFTKNESNQWVLSEYAIKDAKITFDSFEFEIGLDALYDRVDFVEKTSFYQIDK